MGIFHGSINSRTIWFRVCGYGLLFKHGGEMLFSHRYGGGWLWLWRNDTHGIGFRILRPSDLIG